MKFSYMIVIPQTGELVHTASVSGLIVKITELRKEQLASGALALLVQWAKKAVAGQYIQVDQYLVVRTLEKEAH